MDQDLSVPPLVVLRSLSADRVRQGLRSLGALRVVEIHTLHPLDNHLVDINLECLLDPLLVMDPSQDPYLAME